MFAKDAITFYLPEKEVSIQILANFFSSIELPAVFFSIRRDSFEQIVLDSRNCFVCQVQRHREYREKIMSNYEVCSSELMVGFFFFII